MGSRSWRQVPGNHFEEVLSGPIWQLHDYSAGHHSGNSIFCLVDTSSLSSHASNRDYSERILATNHLMKKDSVAPQRCKYQVPYIDKTCFSNENYLLLSSLSLCKDGTIRSLPYLRRSIDNCQVKSPLGLWSSLRGKGENHC